MTIYIHHRNISHEPYTLGELKAEARRQMAAGAGDLGYAIELADDELVKRTRWPEPETWDESYSHSRRNG